MTPPGLRDTKKARNRLALLDALVERLEHRPLEDIAVGELCQAAQISEASFFNYFRRKSDLLLYFIQLWSLEVALEARRDGLQGLAAIEAVFARTARKAGEHPGTFYEVLAYQARMPPLDGVAEVEEADRELRFPGEDCSALPSGGLGPILERELATALDTGELPAHAPMPLLGAGAAAIFFGAPLLLRNTDPGALSEALGSLYQSLLRLLWKSATVN